MKKRLIGLALSAALGAGLPVSPSLALEPLHTMFDDVPVGEWYTTGVTTCANEGIMIGDGNGLFRPEDGLTKAECGMLALRLHELLHWGDGILEKAPEDWGELTLTLADGTVLTSFGREAAPLPGVAGGSFAFDWWSWGMMGHVTANNLQVALRPDPALDRGHGLWPVTPTRRRMARRRSCAPPSTPRTGTAGGGTPIITGSNRVWTSTFLTARRSLPGLISPDAWPWRRVSCRPPLRWTTFPMWTESPTRRSICSMRRGCSTAWTERAPLPGRAP